MYSKSSGFYWNSSSDIQKAPTAALLRPRGLLEITFSEIKVAVEMWRYNPRKLSTRNIVDELSLALALREDADERVEEAVEEMLNELWRKIDGYRN